MLMNFLGQPNLVIISHKLSRLTVSKAYVRSMKGVFKLKFYSLNFF